MKTTPEEREILRKNAKHDKRHIYSWDIENSAILNLLDDIEELQARAENAETALCAAGKSLRTITRGAGKEDGMEDMLSVRGYANSRASVAEAELEAAHTRINDAAAHLRTVIDDVSREGGQTARYLEVLEILER